MTIHLPLATTSELRCRRRCKREHYLTYICGYRDVYKAGPLRFGTATHNALEVWWGLETLGNLALALEAIDSNGEIDEYERAKCRAMMMAYHARWIEADFEILGVERQFEAPLVHPTGTVSDKYQIGGKIDAIIRLPGRGVWIVEHKTTSSDCDFASPYWKKLRIDPQISTYYVGARALGYDVQGCLYDVLRKPAIRQSQIPILDEWGMKIVLDAAGERVKTKDGKKWRETGDTKLGYVVQTRLETPEEFEARCLEVISEAPDKYLVRGEVTRTEDDEKDAAQDIWDQVEELIESNNAKRFPRNPDACEQFGRFCSYFDVCTNVASLDDPTRFRKALRIHEELS